MIELKSKPKLLDLCCGAGGASVGLDRAGFDVTGIDIKPQPHYPFKFYQADALTFPLENYDAYWASPPCQGVSIMRNLPWLKDRNYEVLIAPIRELLRQTGKPYILENVAGARYGSKNLVKFGLQEHAMKAGFLCGTMFGLPIYFHRLFETDFLWLAPAHPKHGQVIREGHDLNGRVRVPTWDNGFRCMDKIGSVVLDGHPSKRDLLRVSQAKGIDWMDATELSQAIPPVYSEYLGKQLMAEVEARKMATLC